MQKLLYEVFQSHVESCVADLQGLHVLHTIMSLQTACEVCSCWKFSALYFVGSTIKVQVNLTGLLHHVTPPTGSRTDSCC